MTSDEVRSRVQEMLGAIAPEVDLDTIDPADDLREQMDLDSMDFLNLMLAVERELGVSVPETDYGRLGTLDALVTYLTERAGPAAE